jgi:arginase
MGLTDNYSNSHSPPNMTSPSTIRPKFLTAPSELGVVAVGFSGGQCKPGVDAAPNALISAGLLTQLRDELGYDLHGDNEVNDYNSLRPKSDPDHRGMKNPRAVSSVTQHLSEQIYSHAKAGRFVLTLGGDHSIAIGTVSGTARAIRERLGREIAVIWVDAHADINTPELSLSGNVHGMPVAFLTGLASAINPTTTTINGSATNGSATNGSATNGSATNGSSYSTGPLPFSWLPSTPPLSVSKLVYIGLRDVDRAEKLILRQHNIRAFSMHDIDRHGIGRVMELALAHIGADTPIHLSFDVDALDPQWAPSTGTPVRGGLTLREGDYIAECVHESGQCVAMDLVEVNPSLEAKGAEETVRAGCSLVRCALGDTLL